MSRKSDVFRACAVIVLVGCGSSPEARGQEIGPRGTGTPAVRLELRIVPQRGLPGDATGVVDLPGTEHDPITMAGPLVSRRFEVQYRLIDNISTDLIVPVGLRSAVVSISAGGPGVGGTGAGQLARAPLSRFEAQLAGATPPVSPDLSGNPDLVVYTGLHNPFRDQITPPPANNNHPANGIPQADGRAITSIMPLSSAPNGQSQAGAWYGLYSFDLFAINVLPGTISLTATAEPELGTGNRFSFWAQNETNPRLSPSATPGTASVLSTVPGPGTGAAAASALLIFASGRRRTVKHAAPQ